MNFVAGEIRKRYSYSPYPISGRETSVSIHVIYPQGSSHDNSVSPFTLFNGVSIDKVGTNGLGVVIWGVVQIGDIPRGLRNIEEIIQHPESDVQMYLVRRNKEPFMSLRFDKNGMVISSVNYAPIARDSVETNIIKFIEEVSIVNEISDISKNK